MFTCCVGIKFPWAYWRQKRIISRRRQDKSGCEVCKNEKRKCKACKRTVFSWLNMHSYDAFSVVWENGVRGIACISAYIWKKEFQSRLLYLPWASPGCRYSECTVKKEVSFRWRCPFPFHWKQCSYKPSSSMAANKLFFYPYAQVSYHSRLQEFKFQLELIGRYFWIRSALTSYLFFPACSAITCSDNIESISYKAIKNKQTQSRTQNQNLHAVLCSQRFSKTKKVRKRPKMANDRGT